MEEYDNELLVSSLCFKGYFYSNVVLEKSSYPFLQNDSILDKYILLIPKEYVLHCSSEKITDEDFEKVMRGFSLDRVFMKDEVKPMFLEYYSNYYDSRIKVGSVVSVEGNKTYFVKEKYDRGFLGVLLRYKPNSGMVVTNEECVVAYTLKFYSILYSEEMKKKIERDINGLSLLLKK